MGITVIHTPEKPLVTEFYLDDDNHYRYEAQPPPVLQVNYQQVMAARPPAQKIRIESA